MLRPFKIKTKTVRIGGTLLKGYRWEQFADAFARHLPDDDEGVRTSDTSDTSDTSTPQSKANVSDVSDASDFQTPPHDGSELAQESWERHTRKKAEHGERPEHPASHAEPSVPHLPDVPLSDTYTEATPEEEALARRLFSLDKSEPPDEQTPDDADSDLIGEVMHRFTEGDL